VHGSDARTTNQNHRSLFTHPRVRPCTARDQDTLPDIPATAARTTCRLARIPGSPDRRARRSEASELANVSWSRVHRWLAIVLVVPLVIWSITGVLFHLKPGWSRAYDMLSIDRPLDALPANPPDAIAAAAAGKVTHLELTNTALGPLYRLTTTAGTVLLDASLHPRSPLSLEDARTLAADAVARSPHGAEYGALRDARIDRGTVDVAFEHANVDIDRDSALLAAKPESDLTRRTRTPRRSERNDVGRARRVSARTCLGPRAKRHRPRPTPSKKQRAAPPASWAEGRLRSKRPEAIRARE
jgi:hypothetical protein